MRKSAQIILIITGGLFTLIMATEASGIILNITKSYPLGFYEKINTPIAKGQMVIFCPAPDAAVQEAVKRGYILSGFCQGGTSAMIKKVFAATGDRVKISNTGVYVNGQLLPNSKPKAADSAYRPMPAIQMNTVIRDSHTFLLMSDYSAKSFDARYFGLTDKSYIISAIRPLWVWKN